VLRKGGTLYLFGYFRILSLLLPLLEKENLKLRQQIVINKGIQAVSGRATKNYKIFPNVTESILMLYKDPKPFVRELLKARQKELGYSSRYINERLGVKSNGGGMWSIYTGKNICEQLPTPDLWDKLQTVLEFEYPYHKLCQTFNAQMGITDVWNDMDFYGINDRIHPTQKPLPLIDRLLLASSNKNDIVLDPFMGSGTTAVSAVNHGRQYIGFECDREYYNKSISRLSEAGALTRPPPCRHPQYSQINIGALV
jgi:DNA modification methylase